MEERPRIKIRHEPTSLTARIEYFGVPSKEEMLLDLINGPFYEALNERKFTDEQRDLRSNIECTVKIMPDPRTGKTILEYTFYKKAA